MVTRGIQLTVTDNIAARDFDWEPGQPGIFEAAGTTFASGVATLYSVSNSGKERSLGSHSAAGLLSFNTAASKLRIKVASVVAAGADFDLMLASSR